MLNAFQRSSIIIAGRRVGILIERSTLDILFAHSTSKAKFASASSTSKAIFSSTSSSISTFPRHPHRCDGSPTPYGRKIHKEVRIERSTLDKHLFFSAISKGALEMTHHSHRIHSYFLSSVCSSSAAWQYTLQTCLQLITATHVVMSSSEKAAGFTVISFVSRFPPVEVVGTARVCQCSTYPRRISAGTLQFPWSHPRRISSHQLLPTTNKDCRHHQAEDKCTI